MRHMSNYVPNININYDVALLAFAKGAVYPFCLMHVLNININFFHYRLATYPKSPMRLVNGLTKYDGRLEIYHNNEWGTICDDNFNGNAAQVACRQLGFNRCGTFIIGFHNLNSAKCLQSLIISLYIIY